MSYLINIQETNCVAVGATNSHNTNLSNLQPCVKNLLKLFREYSLYKKLYCPKINSAIKASLP